MDARLNLFGSPTAGKFLKHLIAANKGLATSTLPAATQELVKLRASQINGCGYCTDMHTKNALHAEESQQRLNLVAAWRRRRSSPRTRGPRWSLSPAALARRPARRK